MNNLNQITAFLPLGVQNEPSLLKKMSNILAACECSRNLMVVLYLIEKKYFLYCNNSFIQLLGEKYNELISRGWDFWFGLIDRDESDYTRRSISEYLDHGDLALPFMIKYHLTDGCNRRVCLKHEILIHYLDNFAIAIHYFFDISDRENIELCFASDSDVKRTRAGHIEYCAISAREKEVLHLISEGYSSKQIANLLYISNHTAISHRKNLIEKFRVKNTAELVKKALNLMQF